MVIIQSEATHHYDSMKYVATQVSCSFHFQTVIYKMLSTYKFKLSDGQDLTHKWLPVSRPVGNLLVDFQPRLPQ